MKSTKYYVFFASHGQPVAGDHGAFIIEGKVSVSAAYIIAREEGKARGFNCYKIVQANNMRNIPRYADITYSMRAK